MATNRHEIFASEYIKDFNAGKAAARAGYSEKTSITQGCRLLNVPQVQEFIRKTINKICKKNEIDANFAIKLLKEMAESDIFDYFDSDDDGYLIFKEKSQLTTAQRRNINEMSVVTTEYEGVKKTITRIKRDDRLKAIDTLAKIQGWYKEREESKNIQIIIDNTDSRL